MGWEILHRVIGVSKRFIINFKLASKFLNFYSSDIPAAVSLPHFYNSDPSLVEGVEGLNPIKEKHDSVIALQPVSYNFLAPNPNPITNCHFFIHLQQIGVPMKVESRVQINLVMGSTRFNTKIEKFQNTAIPIFWAEIKLDRLTDELIFLLQMLFITMPPIQTGKHRITFNGTNMATH